MNAQHEIEDADTAYARSVEQEREAWRAMHSLPPGTPQRARAWDAWSEAIGRTNRAWRQVSARRAAQPRQGGPAAARQDHGHA